jgi:hypothetical protein
MTGSASEPFLVEVAAPDAMRADRLEHLRGICLPLPEVTERSGQHCAFQVRGKTFVWFTDDHHGDGMLAITFKAPPGAQDVLVSSDPDRYFVPPYVGHRGWIGLRLDTDVVDWDEVGDLLTDSYRLLAPRRLAAGVGRP